MIKAVIFDLDGTLIHLPIDYERLFQEFGGILKINNVRPLAKTISKLDEKTKREIFGVWNDTELAASAKLTLNKDGIALYEKFLGKRKALVTMQGKPLVHVVLERLGLSFDVLITREDSLDRVEQLKMAVKRLDAKFQNTVFVGNTDIDFLAAKKVGCQFLRVRE